VPIYRYRCLECCYEEERIITLQEKEEEDEVQICPNCMSETFSSTFGLSSFLLKGGGWYKDGYAKKEN